MRQPQISDAPLRRRAFTLVELLTAMAIMTVVMGAATGSLMIASRAIDDRQGSTAKTLQARDVADSITADLRMALSFTEQNSNAVAFTVPDRDADSVPESIRYAWSDTDETVTREYNGNSAVVLATHVHAFDFTYLNRTVVPPPQPCCDDAGSCTMVPADQCTDDGGTPKDKNLTCADNPCVGACCPGSGSCVETTESLCLGVEFGSYHGDGTFCADASCETPLNVLLVVDDPADLTAHDLDRIALFESWSYDVTLYESDLSQAEFEAAVADRDLAYILPSADGAAIGSKFNSTPKGIVTEYREMTNRLLVWENRWDETTSPAILVTDNTHYITSPFESGLLVLLDSFEKMLKSKDDPAPGTQILASQAADASRTALAVIDGGQLLFDGNRAAGRRVLMPWGSQDIMSSMFTDDGLTLLRRAMEWASEPSSGLVAHWTFDEGGGTTAADSSGNGYDLTLTNMAPASDWVTGRIGGALSFDGVNDFAITAQDFEPPAAGTVAFWMQVPGLPTSHGRILGISDKWEVRHVEPGNPDGIDHGLVFDLLVDGINVEFASNATFGVPGEWYHIAAVYDSTADSFEIYVNGVLDKSGTRTQDVYPAAKLSVGTRTGSTNYWAGTLDDLRIYYRPLTSGEVADLASGT